MQPEPLAKNFLQKDWREIETLNDILFDGPDPLKRLQQALFFVVEKMGCSRGAVLVQLETDTFPQYRVYWNIPASWRVEFEEPAGHFCQMALQILHSNSDIVDDPAWELAGAFPLAFKDKKCGVLFVFGARIEKESLPCWAQLTRAFARATQSWVSGSINFSFTQGIRVYETLRSIQNSRNTLLTFFDSIPVSIYIIDRDFILVSVNLSRSGRSKKHPSILVGKHCYRQLYARNGPCPGCRAMETMENGAVTNRTNHERDAQGKVVEWEITTFPIQEPGQLPHRVIIFEEDVTEKRNLEANLIQSEKLASVGQLAAGVAHEINNPLAAIIANAQLMKRELSKDSELYGSVELIEMAGLRAAHVVSNLLSLARKEENEEFEFISLNENIRSALSLVSHELKIHSIAVQLDLDDQIPLIMANGNHLQGIWINLMMNSIDSIDQDQGQILISTRFSNHEFNIVFEDNGRGISPELLPRIFEPFFTTKPPGKGTGLGLSVCYHVIKEHQGMVSVESQPGLGTRFIITLPDLERQD